MKESERLAGEVAIVTGAGSGIGRAIAATLAVNGAAVACADIDLEAAQESADLLDGDASLAVQVDVADPASVKEMMRTVYEEFGKLTILVNNAGIVRFSQIEECPDEEWDQVLRVDLYGVFYCMREAYPYLVKSGGGRIVNMSSSSGKSGSSFGGPHYTAAKAGILGLTKYAARRWAKDNILVNAICPGLTDTPMARHPEAPQGAFESIVDKVPLGRVAEPEDIAGGVLFLVSEESSYVTGFTLDINGGRYVYGT